MEFPLPPSCLPIDDIERRNTMSTELALVAAALVAVLAGPALARDHARHLPANAYAFAAVRSASVPPAPAYDRQLDARN
jgi:hypothetical protein